MSKTHVISFPHMGDYHVPIQTLLQRIFPQSKVFSAPAMTRKTIALGARYSPDFVCSPFKYNMGNFIESLEMGADVLMQTGLGCRYGYYGELQEQILHDLGYRFEFVWFSRDRAQIHKIYQTAKRLGSPLSMAQMAHAVAVAVEDIRTIDKFAHYMREHMAFEVKRGEMNRLYERLLQEVGTGSSLHTAMRRKGMFLSRLQQMPLEIPERPLHVGIVGELYTVMEPYSNFYIERQLMERGISVSRKMSVSFLLFGKHDALTIHKVGKYLNFPVGANGIDSVSQSRRYAQQQYDGIIHMKSFGCTPELNATPPLMNLSKDYEVPIMHMSFDSHTSETGVQTRLEAFIDMIEMRRNQHETGQPGRRHRVDLNKRRHH